jgi:hypothetical protein
MASPRFDNRHDNSSRPDSALPIGMHMVVHLREPIGDLKWIDGRVTYCSTYGVRLRAADGSEIYTPHANVIGAVGRS